MEKKGIILFYREVQIGLIENIRPGEEHGYTGMFTLTLETPKNPLETKITTYMSDSMKEASFLETNFDEDTMDKFYSNLRNESEFFELINSDDWYIVQEGTKKKILCPLFISLDKIFWIDD